MSDAHLIVIGGLMLAVTGLCAACSLVNVTIVNEVNRKLPQESQFALVGWHLGKISRLRKEYRRLYPDSTLLRKSDSMMIAAALSMAWVAALLFRVV